MRIKLYLLINIKISFGIYLYCCLFHLLGFPLSLLYDCTGTSKRVKIEIILKLSNSLVGIICLPNFCYYVKLTSVGILKGDFIQSISIYEVDHR